MTGLLVVESGPSLLVQDQGRFGWAHLGVPPSGALDPSALRLANRLVGNSEGAAGLEILLGGCVLRAEGSLRIALTGAAMSLRVGGHPAPWGQPVSVRAGDRVEVGGAVDGLRSWLAVSGSIEAATVLGSQSTDTLTGLGPAPVRSGDRLPVGRQPRDVPVAEAPGGRRTTGVCTVEMSLGPRADWFTERALGVLTGSEYVVSSSSDRVAVRLDGPALERTDDAELPSEGIVTGAVQVPASGSPLVFLADHPVTGGYPVVGVVDEVGLARCAQLRPGDRLAFEARVVRL